MVTGPQVQHGPGTWEASVNAEWVDEWVDE